MNDTAFEKELAIRHLLARSSDCVWRKSIHEYGACWATDGEWRILGQVAHGRDEVKALWWQFMDNLQTAWQVAQTIILEIGDEPPAYGRIYLEETLRLRDGTVNLARGIYHDAYRIEAGHWLFSKRHFDLIYMGPTDMAGRFFSTINYGPAPRDPDPSRPATPTMAEAYGPA